VDHIFLVKCGGKPTIVNLLFMTSATYDEEAQRLTINFNGGGSVDIEGQDAVDVWEAVTSDPSDSTTGEDDDDGGESGTAAGENLEDAEIGEDITVESIKRQIADLEDQIQLNRVDRSSGAFNLRYAIELLEKRKPQTEEMERIREKALAVAKAAEIIYYRQRINRFAATPITNISAMKSLLNRLENAKDGLSKWGGMTEEDQRHVRSVKERFAWNRAQKKLEDAKVAEAGGNFKKAEKLKREAAEVIKQDWTYVFPGEPVPSIE
jgi:hypothetical protein